MAVSHRQSAVPERLTPRATRLFKKSGRGKKSHGRMRWPPRRFSSPFLFNSSFLGFFRREGGRPQRGPSSQPTEDVEAGPAPPRPRKNQTARLPPTAPRAAPYTLF